MNYPATVPAFIINLKKRADRREHVLAQFADKPEFDIHLMEPVQHPIATKSLWLTVQQIVKQGKKHQLPFVLICEDDHCFTKHYSAKVLHRHIQTASRLDCDILSGGVNSVKSTFNLLPEIYWMEKFTGLQFTVVFNRLYDAILDLFFNDEDDCADIVISNIARRKLLIYPFISIQKEFGYSDVTVTNNKSGFTDKLFIKSAERVQNLNKVARFYAQAVVDVDTEAVYDDIFIPTYIFHEPGNARRLNNVKRQFEARPEFDVTLVHHPNGISNIDALQSIVKTAVANGDDIIIIASDAVSFKPNYEREVLIKKILQATQLGAAMLLCNTFGFDSAISITPGIAWINSFSGSDMLILFSTAFDAILNDSPSRPPDGSDTLSALTSHKMITHPFMVQAHPDLSPQAAFFHSVAEGRLAFIQAEHTQLLSGNFNINNLTQTYAKQIPNEL